MLKMGKEQIAKVLEEMSALLEFQGEDPSRSAPILMQRIHC